MPDATEAEKAEAAHRLFSVIEILDRVVERLEREAPEKLPFRMHKPEPPKAPAPDGTLPLF